MIPGGHEFFYNGSLWRVRERPPEPLSDLTLSDLILNQTVENADAIMRTLAEIRALPEKEEHGHHH